METDHPDTSIPSILIVDDEKQIHSSLRLRLGDQYQLVCLSNPKEALTIVRHQSFDLCIVDVRMPGMDGLQFIEAARELDPALGYVILSGFDSDENLRRAIPLQVLDFIAKPLPDRTGLERRLPDWIGRTRARRREFALARESEARGRDLDQARIERDVESTASESAREALLQAANLLTTTQALLLNAHYALEALQPKDPRLAPLARSLQEARKNAEAAGAIAEGYFASAYADRESSPAMIDACLRHAIGISSRLAKAEERRQTVDLHPVGGDLQVPGLTGINFLLMLVPAIIQSLELAAAGTTVQIRCDELTRLDQAMDDARWRHFQWVNRRNATLSRPGILLSIRAHAAALETGVATAWLQGGATADLHRPSHGIIHGIQQAKGLLGLAVRPKSDRFELVLALPVG